MKVTFIPMNAPRVSPTTQALRSEVVRSEMALVHRIFRTGLRDVERWVASVPPEGTRRAERLAEHVTFLLDTVNGHHTTEDELVWPALEERIGAEHVAPMHAQHAAVDEAAEEVRRRLSAWRALPSVEHADVLRDALAAYRELLTAHLDQEERDVVPLIAEHVRPDEWARVGPASFEKFPKDKRLIALGQMLGACAPQQAEELLRSLPAPVRWMWRTIGHRQYAHYLTGLAGKPMPSILMGVMRQGIKRGISSYRRSGGTRSNMVKGTPVLLLTVAGRRTGQPHTVPLVFVDIDGSHAVMGSNGGAGVEPSWFRNLRATDRARVELGDRSYDVTVRIPEREERDRIWAQVTTAHPFFAKYQAKGQRLIPVALLTPHDT